jgi:hypothetical protein
MSNIPNAEGRHRQISNNTSLNLDEEASAHISCPIAQDGQSMIKGSKLLTKTD